MTKMIAHNIFIKFVPIRTRALSKTMWLMSVYVSTSGFVIIKILKKILSNARQ